MRERHRVALLVRAKAGDASALWACAEAADNPGAFDVDKLGGGDTRPGRAEYDPGD
jgi:hypothetical protein